MRTKGKLALGIMLLTLVAASVFVLPSLADPKKGAGAEMVPQDGTGEQKRNGKGKQALNGGLDEDCPCEGCEDCAPGECQCPECQANGVPCEGCVCEGCREQAGNREKFNSETLQCPGKGKTQNTPRGQAYGWRKGGWTGKKGLAGVSDPETPVQPNAPTGSA